MSGHMHLFRNTVLYNHQHIKSDVYKIHKSLHCLVQLKLRRISPIWRAHAEVIDYKSVLSQYGPGLCTAMHQVAGGKCVVLTRLFRDCCRTVAEA